jgi:hypothetical protein
MKIVVQNRMTNAYLDQEAKWVDGLERARGFATPWEAIRYCAELGLRGADMLVCFMAPRPNLRVPVS